MAFRSAGVLALVLTAGATFAAAQGTQAQRRFSGMDRNGDGVITRAEWRGSAQSFRVHDWNGDGVLSGDEVRTGARRTDQRTDQPQASDPYRPFNPDQFDDWTTEGFARLDSNRDGRITQNEWRFDRETFLRADHNGDGWISRREFLGGDPTIDDERADRFARLDSNHDGRLSRTEWNGTVERFAVLDDNRDGYVTRSEMLGANLPVPDSQTRTYRAGFDRGLVEGRSAGREDRELRNAWDLEGQRELEGADSGYEPRLGPKAEYQSGYRAGFRRGYREGFGR
jgi:Ca2+-binding EF-hand superfamily protein